MTDQTYSRRKFMHVCSASALLLAGSRRTMADNPLTDYGRVLLVDSNGKPLSCDTLPTARDHVFFYPYASTPCFLLKLAEPTVESAELATADGQSYRWRGGVGPDRSVVAFSAICAHQLTHPSAKVSFIGYREDAVGFLGKENKIERRAGVIQCCSEHSIYDPSQGARVLSGPAPQPLAAIALQTEDDRVYATGVYGGTLFERFFEHFDFRLELEFGDQFRQPVVEQAVVMPLDEYTRQQIRC